MSVRIITGDCRTVLPTMADESINCCVTSPPYFGLRDYGVDGQMGLEATPDEFVAGMVEVFREVRRVLRSDGTLWLNIGDSYARGFGGGSPGQKSATNVGSFEKRKAGKVPEGLKGKDLIGIPWMLAFALRADGWCLRQDIIWSKPNPMPESVQDRCTKAHEYMFLLSKGPRYYYDTAAIVEKAVGDGRNSTEKRNKRSVWNVPTQPFKGAHFATFPPALVEPCILAGCPVGGTVLDPFGGAGTTGLVANRLQRNALMVELNPAYAKIAHARLHGDAGMLAEVAA